MASRLDPIQVPESLRKILEIALQKEASDVHIKAGLIPVIRRHGDLRPLSKDAAPLSHEMVDKMALDIMDEEQRQTFLKMKEVDCGFGITGLGRFRCNVFRQRGSTRMVIRTINAEIPSLAELGLPEQIRKIAHFERGLVLVTGITGSGKSSTLAALINEINNTEHKHILTIEDPIEYLIRDRKSIVSQREVGQDTTSFTRALRAGLRQDPDVILIGEMRDRDTIEIALTAAETGHLVFSTLHTVDAQETISRILSAFEHHQHDQVRRQLAGVIKAVVSQRLCLRKDKSGYVPAVEILFANQRVRECIEDPHRNADLRSVMEESRETFGMQTFDQCLGDLVLNGTIDFQEAMRMSTTPEDFQLRFSGVAAGGSSGWGGRPEQGQSDNANAEEQNYGGIPGGFGINDGPGLSLETGMDHETDGSDDSDLTPASNLNSIFPMAGDEDSANDDSDAASESSLKLFSMRPRGSK